MLLLCYVVTFVLMYYVAKGVLIHLSLRDYSLSANLAPYLTDKLITSKPGFSADFHLNVLLELVLTVAVGRSDQLLSPILLLNSNCFLECDNSILDSSLPRALSIRKLDRPTTHAPTHTHTHTHPRTLIHTHTPHHTLTGTHIHTQHTQHTLTRTRTNAPSLSLSHTPTARTQLLTI